MGLELYYGAFFDLATCRTGMGDGPISWMSIREYAAVNDFDEEQIEDLHYFMVKMDEVFLGYRKKKDGRS